jgi:hypothetical protein
MVLADILLGNSGIKHHIHNAYAYFTVVKYMEESKAIVYEI